MVNQSARTALVTGCSSVIGRETAPRLHQAGLVVYATARRPATLAGLAENGIQVLALDVTDEASMVAAVEAIAAGRGQVDVLVNCAGFELAGTVEENPAGEVRRLFDTYVFGLARLTQLVVPGMRAQRYGRIVNISSVFGRFAVPRRSAAEIQHDSGVGDGQRAAGVLLDRRAAPRSEPGAGGGTPDSLPPSVVAPIS